jgi:hypothetical protein
LGNSKQKIIGLIKIAEVMRWEMGWEMGGDELGFVIDRMMIPRVSSGCE